MTPDELRALLQAGEALEGRTLGDMDLRGADLRKARLRGVKLGRVQLEGADLLGGRSPRHQDGLVRAPRRGPVGR